MKYRDFSGEQAPKVDLIVWSGPGASLPIAAIADVALWHIVWSGRASQADFAELAVSGLASMYPASDWSVLCSGPSWISARVRSH
jgi:hypothetical protein